MRYPILQHIVRQLCATPSKCTKEFCDTIATSIALYENDRCWASKWRSAKEWLSGGPNCALEGPPQHPHRNWRTRPSSHSPSLPTLPSLFPTLPSLFPTLASLFPTLASLFPPSPLALLAMLGERAGRAGVGEGEGS